MRQPLNEFAARLARNEGEVEEFITGLIFEHHVDIGKIREILDRCKDRLDANNPVLQRYRKACADSFNPNAFGPISARY